MLFISLVKFKEKMTRAAVAEMDRMFAAQAKTGIRNIGVYWTLGRIDAIRIFEAPDEKTVMKMLTRNPPTISTETLVAVSREEAVEMLE